MLYVREQDTPHPKKASVDLKQSQVIKVAEHETTMNCPLFLVLYLDIRTLFKCLSTALTHAVQRENHQDNRDG